MCGIAGLFDRLGGRPPDASLLQRMTDRLAHRGPDGDGFHLGPGVGLGHRRLSIIDVAGGRQPMFNEDDTVSVTFNGEIYNYKELVAGLEARGHRFRTHCDTEVILHGWEEWGPACVERFRGMFAFAVHDANTDTLFLARDRFGKKPLFYAPLADGWVAFASELKALLIDPRLPREIDPTAVEDFFSLGYVPETKSIYRAARKLPPGHFLVIRRGSALPEPVAYWDLDPTQRSEFGDADEAAASLRDRLSEAVRLRLVSEVPLGAFLSGGVDSSTVVATMAGLSDRPVRSFAISFTEAAFDESRHAERIATLYKTDHRTRRVAAADFDLLDRAPAIFDEPFADSSALPTLRVCEVAREQVTVALSGDGGDEVFAGYRRYRWHDMAERLRGVLPDSVRRPIFGTLGRLYPQLDWAPRPLRAKATLLELGLSTVDAFFRIVSTNPDETRSRLFTDTFRHALQGYHAREVLRPHFDRAAGADPLWRAQYVDLKTWLAGDILTKVDRTSMAASLEVRAPFLDHEFAAWGLGLPPAARLQGGVGKWLLKKAAEPLVPHDILYRPKQGFSIPVADWLRGPLRGRLEAAVRGPRIRDTGWFSAPYLEEAMAQHASGRRDWHPLLWALLMFDGFLRDVHEARAPHTPLVSEAAAE